jgi:hypothetical protein
MHHLPNQKDVTNTGVKNLLSPNTVKQAAAEIKDGQRFSLK